MGDGHGSIFYIREPSVKHILGYTGRAMREGWEVSSPINLTKSLGSA